MTAVRSRSTRLHVGRRLLHVQLAADKMLAQALEEEDTVYSKQNADEELTTWYYCCAHLPYFTVLDPTKLGLMRTWWRTRALRCIS